MSCHGREWPKNLAIAFREFHGWANDFHAVHIPLTLEGCTEREGGRRGEKHRVVANLVVILVIALQQKRQPQQRRLCV